MPPRASSAVERPSPREVLWPPAQTYTRPIVKITIELADDLIERAKAHAAKQGITLRALVEKGLRHVLSADEEPVPFQLQDASVGGRGLRLEFRGADWHRIREAAYEGRGG